MDRKDTKINVMLTAEEARRLEDMMLGQRMRSMSAFVRQLVLEAMEARVNRTPPAPGDAPPGGA